MVGWGAMEQSSLSHSFVIDVNGQLNSTGLQHGNEEQAAGCTRIYGRVNPHSQHSVLPTLRAAQSSVTLYKDKVRGFYEYVQLPTSYSFSSQNSNTCARGVVFQLSLEK